MRRALSVAGGGLLLVLIAFMFDAAPLFVVGIGFLAVGLGAPGWVWLSARHTSVRRELKHDRVIEEEPFETTIEVRRGPLGLPGAELHDPLAHAPVALSAPLSLVRGKRSVSVRVVSRFSRRGLRRLDPPTLLVRDPLDLVNLECRGAGSTQELLVLPFTEPVRWSMRRRARRSEHAGGRNPGEPLAAVDIDGLRPYQLGTPASRIHWPALARGAGLLERRLRADGDTRPLVVLDARGSGPHEYLDAAVRAAASLTLELARAGGCRLLLPGDRRALTIESDLASWPAAHARLALVEGGPGVRAPVLDPGGRVGPLFYVGTQPLDRVAAGLNGARQGGAVALVVPKARVEESTARPSFEVAGCCGFVLGSLSLARGERVA